ncbi:MAG TPA: DUF3606 domain-containing protein [Burkholderiaceae bacterium]|nr:DUF3606 domain-containing protein [Burkholderiaceae bacterium]
MADNTALAAGSDRKRINVNQDHELRDWSKKFGVTPEALQAAVKAVGDRAVDVQTYLAGIARDGGAGPASS